MSFKLYTAVVFDGSEMKDIQYFGNLFRVPKSTNYVTTDSDGSIYAHTIQPTFNEKLGIWNNDLGKGLLYLAEAGYFEGNPAHSLEVV